MFRGSCYGPLAYIETREEVDHNIAVPKGKSGKEETVPISDLAKAHSESSDCLSVSEAELRKTVLIPGKSQGAKTIVREC